eukprot:5925593-Lingulodinium_polyedra.AAC.1
MEDTFTGKKACGVLCASVVDGPAPLLLSKGFFTDLKAVLFAEERALWLRALDATVDLPDRSPRRAVIS